MDTTEGDDASRLQTYHIAVSPSSHSAITNEGVVTPTDGSSGHESIPHYGGHGGSFRTQKESNRQSSEDSERASIREAPRGNPKPLARQCVGYGYNMNSYFARRLWLTMMILAAVDLVAIIQFWTSDDLDDGGIFINDISNSMTFRKSSCEVKTTACDSCYTVVAYSTFMYHLLPFVILIGLPASGLRVFEPFKREVSRSPGIRRLKVKRTLYLQVCELACVNVIIITILMFLYIQFSIMRGYAMECNVAQVRLYAMGAGISYISTFVEITYFVRFREHIKMQLGAFKEADQTGDIRGWFSRRRQRNRTEKDVIVKDIRKKLYKATELNNLREMENILAYAQNRLGDDFAEDMYKDASITLRFFGSSKKNPMHKAAYHGNVPAMTLLFNAGFRMDSYDKVARLRFSTGDLFLYFANLFVSRPVMSTDDSAGSIFRTTLVTPLHSAVSTGQISAVKWLIEHGADVNLKSKSSYWSERLPPLFLADNPEIVRVLLEAGANYLEVPDPGRMNTITVLQLAYLRGNIPVAHELENWGADVALTPLHEAAASDKAAMVKRFLKMGADPNCVGELEYVGMHRRTPLHWAAINGSTRAVEALLAAGADPNFQDVYGRTPLHWAARVNRPEVVRLLLQRGGDPQLRDYEGKTPLLCAASAKDVPETLFQCLIEHGADVNDHLHNGDTGLHIAVKGEQQNTALAMLGAGADIMRTNYDGLRPLDCTTSTKMQFEIKRAAGSRDVMISYTHSHSEFALKLRKSLEDANITTWLDMMDPSGIGGGSVWREEIARGIKNAAMVVCILTEDYPRSEWCLKELALAKEIGKPILAVSTEHVPVTDDLQVYLYTRQMVPFEPAITIVNKSDSRNITYEYNEDVYSSQFRLLLDGVRDEIEKQRKERMAHIGHHTSDDRINAGNYNTSIAEWDATTLGASDFVFIAHGDEHHNFVRRIYERLSENGIQCFLDGTQSYIDMTERIYASKEAILKCSVFVVVVSGKTATNELVRDQLAFAEDKGRTIFPIMLNDMDIGLDKLYTLSRLDLYHFTPELGFDASFIHFFTQMRNHVVPVNMLAQRNQRSFSGSSFFTVTMASERGNVPHLSMDAIMSPPLVKPLISDVN